MSEKWFIFWYGRTFYFFTFNSLMLSDAHLKAGELIAVLDASFMIKSGNHKEELGNFLRGCYGAIAACKVSEVLQTREETKQVIFEYIKPESVRSLLYWKIFQNLI